MRAVKALFVALVALLLTSCGAGPPIDEAGEIYDQYDGSR